MARNIPEERRLYRGTTTQHAAYTGPQGEVTVDTSKNTVVVQDGATAGGIPLALEAYFPADYFARGELMTPAKTTVTIPSGTVANVGGKLLASTEDVTLSLATWVTAANRAGKDMYVYMCDDGSRTPVFVVSLNSTVPSGYTASTSRKIGGFHCLCADVGTIEGHTLSGYVAGDVLPTSVWDLKHRARSGSNEGMAFVNGAWHGIYLASWDGEKLVSAYGGTVVSGTASSMPMHGEKFAEQAGLQSMRLPRRDEFVVYAKGSNEGTNIAGSARVATTGGNVDTESRRMISNYGLENCCGSYWQWTSDVWGVSNIDADGHPQYGKGSLNGSRYYSDGFNWDDNAMAETLGWTSENTYSVSGTRMYHSSIDSGDEMGGSYGVLLRARVGAHWSDGSRCGSRSVNLRSLSAGVASSSAARLASEPSGD